MEENLFNKQHKRASLQDSFEKEPGKVRNEGFSALVGLEKPDHFSFHYPKDYLTGLLIQNKDFIPPFVPECYEDKETLKELSTVYHTPDLRTFVSWLGFATTMWHKNKRFGTKQIEKPREGKPQRSFVGNLTWQTYTEEVPEFSLRGCKDFKKKIPTPKDPQVLAKHFCVQKIKKQPNIFNSVFTTELRFILEGLGIEANKALEEAKERRKAGSSSYADLDLLANPKRDQVYSDDIDRQLHKLIRCIPNYTGKEYEIVHYYLKNRKNSKVTPSDYLKLPSSLYSLVDLSNCQTEEEEYKAIEEVFEKAKEVYLQGKNTHVLYFAAELARYNFNRKLVYRKLRDLIEDYTDLKNTVGMPLHQRTRRLVIDIDNYSGAPALVTLSEIMRILKIQVKNVLFVERNYRAGGIHVFFSTKDYITPETAENVENYLKKKEIKVEIKKFYSGKQILRYPGSKEYEPIKLDKNFIKNLQYTQSGSTFFEDYMYKSPKEYPITSQTFEKICLNQKTEEEKEQDRKKRNYDFWHGPSGRVYYRVNTDTTYNNSKGYRFKPIEAGQRYATMGVEVPLLKAQGYSLVEVAEDFLRRKGTSKDLNRWSLGEVMDSISGYYDSCKLYKTSDNSWLTITRKPKQFSSSLYYMDGAESILSHVFLHNKQALYDSFRMFQENFIARYNAGKRLFSNKERNTFYALFNAFICFEIFGKCAYSIKTPRWVNSSYLRQFMGQQFPNEFFDKAFESFVDSIFNVGSVIPCSREINRILYPLFKDILEEPEIKNAKDEEQKRLFIQHYFQSKIKIHNTYKYKKVILEDILQFPEIKRDKFQHSKNSCTSYQVNTINEVCSYLEKYLNTLFQHSYFTVSFCSKGKKDFKREENEEKMQIISFFRNIKKNLSQPVYASLPKFFHPFDPNIPDDLAQELLAEGELQFKEFSFKDFNTFEMTNFFQRTLQDIKNNDLKKELLNLRTKFQEYLLNFTLKLDLKYERNKNFLDYLLNLKGIYLSLVVDMNKCLDKFDSLEKEIKKRLLVLWEKERKATKIPINIYIY